MHLLPGYNFHHWQFVGESLKFSPYFLLGVNNAHGALDGIFYIFFAEK